MDRQTGPPSRTGGGGVWGITWMMVSLNTAGGCALIDFTWLALRIDPFLFLHLLPPTPSISLFVLEV